MPNHKEQNHFMGLAAIISPVYILRYDDEPQESIDVELSDLNTNLYKIENYSRILGMLNFEVNSAPVLVATPLTFIFSLRHGQENVAISEANKLAFFLFLGGINVEGIQRNDIGMCEINTNGYYMLLAPNKGERFRKNLSMQQRALSPIEIIEFYKAKVLTIEEISKAIEVGESIAKDFDVAYDFLLNGLALYKSENYLTSFIFLFTALESLVVWYWGLFISSKKLTKSKSFVTSKSLSIATRIEFLRFSGCINENLYERIDNSRRIRNNILHSMTNVNKNECKNCIRAIHEFMICTMPCHKKTFSICFSSYLKNENSKFPSDINDGVWLRLNTVPGSRYHAGEIPCCKTQKLYAKNSI